MQRKRASNILHRWLIGLFFLSLSCSCASPSRTPVSEKSPIPILFDTDIGNDIDDAIALAILHSLESLNEAKLLAVTITKENRCAAPYVELVNTFYGRPDIPVGVVHNGVTPQDSPMICVPSERRNSDNSFVYPHKLVDGLKAPDAIEVLRNALLQEEDGSVVMVQVGSSTNYARLLETDRDLILQKVRVLLMMAGAFPQGNPEYNIIADLVSARKIFSSWPTPIIASGYEIGNAIRFPAMVIEEDFGYVANHPIAEAYRLFDKMPYSRPLWDPTATLYAVRPYAEYFTLSKPGIISLESDGRTVFTEASFGKDRYLVVDDVQRERVLRSIIELSIFPPAR